jgi:hypothetical protein
MSIDHGWQLAPFPQVTVTREMAENAARLETVSRRVIADRGVDLICEECDPRYVSVAQKIAYEHDPRIPWRNIVMTSQERLEAGIYEALLDRPYDTVEIPPDSGNFQTIHHRIPATLHASFFLPINPFKQEMGLALEMFLSCAGTCTRSSLGAF